MVRVLKRKKKAAPKQREDWLAQVRRGLLELCVLALINRTSTYGYEIVTQLSRSPHLASFRASAALSWGPVSWSRPFGDGASRRRH